MAYDYLNKTTYSDDVAQQNELLAGLMSGAQQQEAPDYSDFVELGSGLDNTESDLVPIDEAEPQSVADTTHDFENEQPDETDYTLMNYLLSDDEQQSPAERSMTNADTVYAQDPSGNNIDLAWLRRKNDSVNLNNLNSGLSKYLMTLPDDLKDSLVATSGDDQEHAANSRHYSGDAIDLRFNNDAYKYILNDPLAKQYGVEMLDPNHGTAKHIHLQTKAAGGGIHINPANRGKFTASAERHHMSVQEYASHVLHDPHASSTERKRANFARNASHWKHQAGGSTLNATTASQLTTGLNNPQYNNAILHLSGMNTIRGLDNHNPVAVTDGSRYKILRGPNDTAQFSGKVYEHRI